VLAIVLGTVVVRQLPDSSTAPTLAREQTPSSRSASSRRPSANPLSAPQNTSPTNDSEQSSDATQEKQIAKSWPKLSLDKILAHDPLAAPDWLLAAKSDAPTVDDEGRLLAQSKSRARNAEVLEQLREEGTKVVVISGGEKRAIIGDQTVRIGDLIEGFQITDITRQGVVLTEVEQN
jgi:hypothetical protein